MAYSYLKALHIIFVVTWFAGLFYVPRLFIYNTEANGKQEPDRKILQVQLGVMMRRLWYGITWPSALLTLVLGIIVLFKGNWNYVVFGEPGRWLLIKLVLVVLLYGYHLTLHRLCRQQIAGIFRYSSQQLRLWNEVATVFLVAIVLLATVKQGISFIWGIIGLVLFIVLLLAAIRIYKHFRKD